MDKRHAPRQRSSQPAALRAMQPEVELADDFKIRSFAKGLSQRRILVRDTESGVKLTIAQVRAAAVELIKLGGEAAAHEFALAAAASAAAMNSARDAVAVAAREALEAARNAYAWFAWGDGRESTVAELRDESPPRVRPASIPASIVNRRWRETSQAA